MTMEECIEFENKLHRQYIEPFDKLLERKAEYYLKNPNPYLLDEIEKMNALREYVGRLETMLQEQLSITYKVVRELTATRAALKAEYEFSQKNNEILKLLIEFANVRNR